MIILFGKAVEDALEFPKDKKFLAGKYFKYEEEFFSLYITIYPPNFFFPRGFEFSIYKEDDVPSSIYFVEIKNGAEKCTLPDYKEITKEEFYKKILEIEKSICITIDILLDQDGVTR